MLSFPLPHLTEEQRASERLTQIADLQPTSGGAGFKSPESTFSSPQKITFLADTTPPAACLGAVLGAVSPGRLAYCKTLSRLFVFLKLKTGKNIQSYCL